MESKAERTRNIIVEKASHLFNRKGFHGTSMSDILEATGFAKGGIYGHFKSKEEILEASFKHAFGIVMDELSIKIRNQSSAIDKVDAIIDFYRSYLSNPPVKGGCPILNYAGHSLDEAPGMAKLISDATKLMLESLTRILEKGIKHGQIKPSVDPVESAEIIYSRIEGAIMLAKTTGDDRRLQRLLDVVQREVHADLPA